MSDFRSRKDGSHYPINSGTPMYPSPKTFRTSYMKIGLQEIKDIPSGWTNHNAWGRVPIVHAMYDSRKYTVTIADTEMIQPYIADKEQNIVIYATSKGKEYGPGCTHGCSLYPVAVEYADTPEEANSKALQMMQKCDNGNYPYDSWGGSRWHYRIYRKSPNTTFYQHARSVLNDEHASDVKKELEQQGYMVRIEKEHL